MISDIFNNIKKSTLVRNTLTISSGALLAQMLTFLLTPIITRIFGPEAYGVYGLFGSIGATIVPMAALTYEHAIVLPDSEEESIDLLKLSILVVSIISVFVLILSFFFQNQLLTLFDVDGLGNYVNLVWLLVLFYGVQNILMQWLIRKKLFRVRASAGIINALIVNCLTIIVGYFYPKASILIVISILGHFVYIVTILLQVGRLSESITFVLSPIKTLKKTNWLNLKKVAKKYKDYPLFRTPQITINSFSINLPILFLSTVYGASSTGFFSIANRVLGVPTTLIANAVGDAFYPHVNELAKFKKTITKSYVKAVFSLVLIGILPFGILFLFGPFLFGLFFGQEWGVAGEYARWLAFSSYFIFLTRPAVRILNVINEQRFFLSFTVFKLIIDFLALLTANIFIHDPLTVIIVYSFINGITYLFLAIICYIKCRKFDLNITKTRPNS